MTHEKYEGLAKEISTNYHFEMVKTVD